MKLTCYTDVWGDLLTYDTDETIRRATAAERAESDASGATGAFAAAVSERTLRRRCPRWVRMQEQIDEAERSLR